MNANQEARTYDDPAHGQQQLVMFHGYYNQYQYQPRIITCADNDLIVMACLLYGSAHPALGIEDVLAVPGVLRNGQPSRHRANSRAGLTPRQFEILACLAEYTAWGERGWCRHSRSKTICCSRFTTRLSPIRLMNAGLNNPG